jgi:hypothetical protein
MIYLNQFFVDRVASPKEESVAHQIPSFILHSLIPNKQIVLFDRPFSALKSSKTKRT